jgi:hypothetical protein
MRPRSGAAVRTSVACGRGRAWTAALAFTLGLAAASACSTSRPGRWAVFGASPCVRAFVFVDHGRPAATIVIPEAAGAVERRAAEILQSSIRKMSGVTLPVMAAGAPGPGHAAAIGFDGDDLPPALASLRSSVRTDGFLVGTTTGNLYVISGGGKGAVYGVVHLLEKHFGCRMYGPAAGVFPHRDDLALGCLLERENPANEVRIVNGDFARDPDYRDWMRLHVPDEIYGAGYYVHTFQKLVPWQEHFAAHPEYFAWMNGKRIIDQPCLSRPEVFDLVVARLREEMAAQPDKRVWSVSQNDNFSYCQCPECAAAIEEEGSPSGPLIRFVNRVAAAFPDKIISTLAYQSTRPAPRLTRPAPNVEIMLCTIECDRSRPLTDTPSGRAFVRDLEDWARICDRIYLWDYTVNFSHFVSPFPNLHVLEPNIRLFMGHGVRRHFQQTNAGPGHEFSELKAYVLARLLWRPNGDVKAILRDFIDGYYGRTGPSIRRYIEALQGALERSGAGLDIYEPPTAHAEGFLSEADVAAYNAIFDKAEAAAAGDPAVLLRVRTARLPLMYAMIEIGKNDLFGPRGFFVEKGGRYAVKPAMAALLDEFLERCRAAGVRNLNEAGLTPEAYHEASKRFIDVQIEGNLAFRRAVTADPQPSPKYAMGDLAVLTNGVQGAHDFRVHWLGWEGVDATLTLDLGAAKTVRAIALSTLSDQRSWILHPRSVGCSVSADGISFRDLGTITVEGDHRGEETVRPFDWRAGELFDPAALAAVRYVRFRVEGTKSLPDWHASAGGASWFFVDEIVVR